VAGRIVSAFVPDEQGFQVLLDSPEGFVGRDLERRLINCVNAAKVYATGAPTALATNREGRGPNVRTDRLRSSIAYEIVTEGAGLVGRYGTNVPYGFWLETGLRNGATYPFLRPAIPAAFL
jgi:hypothetical protein